MSTNLSPAFETMFNSEVHHAYQSSRTLDGVCRMKNGVVGSTYKWPKLAAGVATERSPQTNVTALNTAFSQVSVSLQDWSASEYSDVFNNAKVSFEERNELATVVGSAIGRRYDQLIIDSVIAASAGTTVANTVVTSGSATASNLNVGKLIAAKKALDAANVPSADRHLVCHANNLAGLLGDERAVSSDYNSIRALSQGQINSYLGFQFHVLGTRTEGGVPVDGSSDRTVIAFHKSAVGCAVGINPRTEINYIPEKTSWLVTTMLSMGSVAIDAAGIVDITCRE
tara:strand:- start:76 stop:927 length:852 start_codon:yes stop_codon:yes gene_type:complete